MTTAVGHSGRLMDSLFHHFRSRAQNANDDAGSERRRSDKPHGRRGDASGKRSYITRRRFRPARRRQLPPLRRLRLRGGDIYERFATACRRRWHHSIAYLRGSSCANDYYRRLPTVPPLVIYNTIYYAIRSPCRGITSFASAFPMATALSMLQCHGSILIEMPRFRGLAFDTAELPSRTHIEGPPYLLIAITTRFSCFSPQLRIFRSLFDDSRAKCHVMPRLLQFAITLQLV